MKLDNPIVVQWEYASEERLATRNETYHVPDLDRGVAEIARVLAPGGRLVAATLSGGHMCELWESLGVEPTSGLSFQSGNGDAALRPHFASVERRDAFGSIVFPDADSIRAFVGAATTRAHLASNVPEITEPFRTSSAHAVFVAEKAA